MAAIPPGNIFFHVTDSVGEHYLAADDHGFATFQEAAEGMPAYLKIMYFRESTNEDIAAVREAAGGNFDTAMLNLQFDTALAAMLKATAERTFTHGGNLYASIPVALSTIDFAEKLLDDTGMDETVPRIYTLITPDDLKATSPVLEAAMKATAAYKALKGGEEPATQLPPGWRISLDGRLHTPSGQKYRISEITINGKTITIDPNNLQEVQKAIATFLAANNLFRKLDEPGITKVQISPTEVKVTKSDETASERYQSTNYPSHFRTLMLTLRTSIAVPTEAEAEITLYQEASDQAATQKIVSDKSGYFYDLDDITYFVDPADIMDVESEGIAVSEIESPEIDDDLVLEAPREEDPLSAMFVEGEPPPLFIRPCSPEVLAQLRRRSNFTDADAEQIQDHKGVQFLREENGEFHAPKKARIITIPTTDRVTIYQSIHAAVQVLPDEGNVAIDLSEWTDATGLTPTVIQQYFATAAGYRPLAFFVREANPAEEEEEE